MDFNDLTKIIEENKSNFDKEDKFIEIFLNNLAQLNLIRRIIMHSALQIMMRKN